MFEWVEVNQYWHRQPSPKSPVQEEYEELRITLDGAEFGHAKDELFSRSQEGPEWDRYREDFRIWAEQPVFSHALKVGMLVELSTGQRILVGDCSDDGSVGGCCAMDLPRDSFVVRYCMIPGLKEYDSSST